MKKSRLLKAFAVTLCLVLAFAFLTVESYAKTTKGEVDASVKAAKGVLIMPNITKAAFILGAQYGTGALSGSRPGRQGRHAPDLQQSFRGMHGRPRIHC